MSDEETLRERMARVEGELKVLAASVDRMTNAVYNAAIAILATGVLGVLAALVLKGVIG